jgi:hypothetical protein
MPMTDPTNSRPVPDPTTLTTNAVNQAVEQSRRELAAAVEILNSKITCLQEVSDERFKALEQRFHDRDARAQEQDLANKEAIAAALSAQKELAAQQDNTNQNAIDKNEKLTEKGFEGLKTQTDDLKDRVGRIESMREGSGRLVSAQLAAATVIITIIVIIVNILTSSVTK